MFESAWAGVCGAKWTNDTTAGAKFRARFDKCYDKMLFDSMRDKMNAGNLNTFDGPLLLYTLSHLDRTIRKNPWFIPLNEARNIVQKSRSLDQPD